MKKFFFFLIIALIAATVLTLCKRKSGPEKLNGEEVKAKYGIVFPDLEYEGDEPPTIAPGARGVAKKGKAAAFTFEVYPNSLPIELTGETIASSAPANTEWFGGQKFIDTTTNDSAKGLWGCGRYYSTPPTSPQPVICQTEGTGFYRFFASDFQKNIRLSPFARKE